MTIWAVAATLDWICKLDLTPGRHDVAPSELAWPRRGLAHAVSASAAAAPSAAGRTQPNIASALRG